MKVSAELIHDYDHLAATLGLTPVFDSVSGEIVPIGQPEGGKKTVYVVWVGRALGLFHNWGLTSAMTSGFPNCAYKRYPDLARARVGWAQGPTGGAGQWRVPRPRAAVPTPSEPPSRRADVAAAPTPPPQRGQLPREVRVEAPSPQPGVLSASFEEPEDDAFYWDDVNDDTHAFTDAPDIPLSPTITSVSTLSLSSSPHLTSGTISPRTIATPSVSAGSIWGYESPDQAEISRTLSCPIPLVSSPPPIRRRRLDAHDSVSTPKSNPSPSSPSRRPRPVPVPPAATQPRSSRVRGSGSDSAPLGTPSASMQAEGPESKPKAYFVVVRGDYPGIYFNRSTALAMLGTSPGMKLVAFRSLSKASWYFVQQYMRRQVGVPVLDESEAW